MATSDHKQKAIEVLVWVNDPVGTLRVVLAPKFLGKLVMQLAAVRGTVSDPAQWDKSPIGRLYAALDKGMR